MENNKIKAIEINYGTTARVIVPVTAIVALWPNGSGYDVVLSGILPSGNNIIHNGITPGDAIRYFDLINREKS